MSIRDFGAGRLRALVANYLEIDVSRVVDEAHLSDDLGVDWLDQIELLIMIEDEFEGVKFSEATAVDFVGDLIRHVEITWHLGSEPRRSAA
jgi:acyl carrier protein